MTSLLKKNIAFAVLAIFVHTAGYGHDCQFARVAQLPVTWSENGLQPIVNGSINGTKVALLFDTGASTTALTRHIVRDLGLPMESAAGYFYGVGGVSDAYAASLKEISIGPVSTSDIKLHVIGDMTGGEDYAALIGADFALQMDLEVWLAAKQINFFRTKNCDNVFLGYWDKDAMEVPMISSTRAPSPIIKIELNGVEINAIVDTGAMTTAVTRKAAEKAGVIPDEHRVTKDGVVGIGRERVKSWRAKFNVRIGDETIQNAPLTIMDKEFSIFDEASMLIGQDWLRAHRVLFARSQRRMVFTYLGGDIFPTTTGAPWFAKDAENGMASAQYAMALYDADNQDFAAAENWMKKAAVQGNINANFALGRGYLIEGKFDEAERHLEAGLKRQPSNAYMALWLYLAQFSSRGENVAASTLAANKTIDPEYWPYSLVQFYLGRGSADAVRKEAEKYGGDICKADYLMRLWNALHGDDAGKKARGESSDDCHPD